MRSCEVCAVLLSCERISYEYLRIVCWVLALFELFAVVRGRYVGLFWCSL